MTTKTKHPQKDPCAWLDDAVERATQWRNLYFDKSGKCYYGADIEVPSERTRTLWPSEQAAFEVAENLAALMAEPAKPGKRPYYSFETGRLFCDEYSHHMQIPVKGE